MSAKIGLLSERQRELARHAIGLPNNNRRSYRNSFVAGREHDDYADWLAMCEAGAAYRRDGTKLAFGGSDLFHVTLAGAEDATNPDETLDPEDFPQ
jgi:hypothetical protein